MPQQNLDDTGIDTALQKMGGKALPQRVHADLLGQTCRLGGGPARRMQKGNVDRPFCVPPMTALAKRYVQGSQNQSFRALPLEMNEGAVSLLASVSENGRNCGGAGPSI